MRVHFEPEGDSLPPDKWHTVEDMQHALELAAPTRPPALWVADERIKYPNGNPCTAMKYNLKWSTRHAQV